MEMDKIVYYLHHVGSQGDVVYYISPGDNISVGARKHERRGNNSKGSHAGFAKQILRDCPYMISLYSSALFPRNEILKKRIKNDIAKAPPNTAGR